LTADEPIAADDIMQQELYAQPLEGAAFRQDNSTVWALLKSAIITSPAWECIKQLDGKNDGRLAMTKLRAHYDGPDKQRSRISMSKADIEKTFYKNARALSFEKFITKLTGAFQVLTQHGEPYSDQKKLRTLLGKINSNDLDVIAGVAVLQINSPQFDNAVASLAGIVQSSRSKNSLTLALTFHPVHHIQHAFIAFAVLFKIPDPIADSSPSEDVDVHGGHTFTIDIPDTACLVVSHTLHHKSCLPSPRRILSYHLVFESS
jgi:hypothetical protein